MTRSEIICNQYGEVHWWPDGEKRSQAFVCSVHVNEGHRGKGHGTRLMLQLAQHLWKHRFWTIELDNCSDPKSLFYERLGFAYLDQHDNAMTVKTRRLIECCSKLLTPVR